MSRRKFWNVRLRELISAQAEYRVRGRRKKEAKARALDNISTPAQIVSPERPGILTWESEVRAIAQEATAWEVETGGDLFGRLDSTPIIYLATRVGPKAVRDLAHFRLDVDYLRELSDVLAAEWGLRYLGDWHSHHRLGLTEPSAGDRRRIESVARRNTFPTMAEIIVTFGSEQGQPNVRVHPWTYSPDLHSARIIVLPGISPVREAIVTRGALPEQEPDRWTEIPLGRVEMETSAISPEAASTSLIEPVVARLVSQARHALEEEAGRPVEEHPAPFGTVLAAPVNSSRLIAFAVSRAWPCEILEVDWIDREGRTSEVVNVSAGTNLLVPDEVAVMYRSVLKLKEDETDVDNVTA